MQEPKTLNDIYAATVAIDRPAIMKYKSGDQWIDVTVPEFRDSVHGFAYALHDLGVKAGDRVAILSENRPEWTISDFAILCAAAITVPVYPTLLGWQIEYILNDSGSVACLASTEEQLHKLIDIRSHCPHLHTIIVADAIADLAPGVMTLEQVVAEGRKSEQEQGRGRFDEIRTSRKADDLATIVYTSGTTGNPKGAMLTHGNIASNVASVTKVLPLQRGWMAMSILPLSHILE